MGASHVCLGLCPLDEGHFLVASGGDDNALRVQVVHWSCGGGVDLGAVVEATSAHASSITGLAFVTATRLASLGSDGRLCLWDLTGLEVGRHGGTSSSFFIY